MQAVGARGRLHPACGPAPGSASESASESSPGTLSGSISPGAGPRARRMRGATSGQDLSESGATQRRRSGTLLDEGDDVGAARVEHVPHGALLRPQVRGQPLEEAPAGTRERERERERARARGREGERERERGRSYALVKVTVLVKVTAPGPSRRAGQSRPPHITHCRLTPHRPLLSGCTCCARGGGTPGPGALERHLSRFAGHYTPATPFRAIIRVPHLLRSRRSSGGRSGRTASTSYARAGCVFARLLKNRAVALWVSASSCAAASRRSSSCTCTKQTEEGGRASARELGGAEVCRGKGGAETERSPAEQPGGGTRARVQARNLMNE